MFTPSAAFIELLAGKTPEAMYDALYAGRYLTAAAIDSPAEVLEAIKVTIRSHRPRAFSPPVQVELIARMLAASDYLNESGLRLFRG
jgi:hypothetical protein